MNPTHFVKLWEKRGTFINHLQQPGFVVGQVDPCEESWDVPVKIKEFLRILGLLLNDGL